MSDKKITQLTELVTPTDADLVPIVNDPSGSPATRKITVANIRAVMKGDTGASVKGDTGSAGSKGDTGTQGGKGDTGAGGVLGFNVETYGATGDGSTDDTTAIQAAIDAASTAKSTVVFPAGTYLTGQLVWKADVNIQGAGIGKTIIKAKNALNNDLLITANFATEHNNNYNGYTTMNRNFLRDITFQGNAGNQTIQAVQADKSAYHYLVKFYGWLPVFENVEFDDCEAALYTEYSNNQPHDPFEIYELFEGRFTGLRAKNYARAGWTFRGPHDSYIQDIKLSGGDYDFPDYHFLADNNGNFGGQSSTLNDVHLWGNTSATGYNAIIGVGLSGVLYAEGSTNSNVIIQSGGCNLDILLGFQDADDNTTNDAGVIIDGTAGVNANLNTLRVQAYYGPLNGDIVRIVENGGQARGNHITTTIQAGATVSGSEYKLVGTPQANYLVSRQGQCANIWDLTEYTGGNNSFITEGRKYRGGSYTYYLTAFTGNYSAGSDYVWVFLDAYPDWERLHIMNMPDNYDGAVAFNGGSKAKYLTALGGATRRVHDVKDYGAVGDDSTDDITAIRAAIAASAEGDIIDFPSGIYRISEPLVLTRNRTYRGSHSPRWSYRGGVACAIKPHSTFTGDQIIHVPDKEITSLSDDNDGGRILNLAIDGNSFGSTLIGIEFEGLVRDWHLRDVDVSQTSGNGIVTSAYTRADESVVYPRGFTLENVSGYSAGNSGGAGNGFVLNSLTDSTLINCLAVGSESIGFLIDSPGETKYIGCRAVFCNSDGFRITGNVSVGGSQFIGCSTDRNQKYGVLITATGTQPIQFTGLLQRRDGANTATSPSGLGIIGSAGNTVCPVSIVGLDQTIGFDDGGGGSESPIYGVTVTYAQRIFISGTIWGKTAAVSNGGNVDSFEYYQAYLRVGTAGTVTQAQSIKDKNSNTVLAFGENTSAVNYLTIKNNATGSSPRLEAAGTDNNISINLVPKGTGSVLKDGVAIPTNSSTSTLTNKTLTSPKINEDVVLTPTATELNYVEGVTSPIQTQLDAMVEKAGDTMTGDLQLGETDIKLDAVLSNDEKWSGIVIAGTAGATLAVGDVCYLASSGKWLLNDGILDGTDTGFSKQLGICVLAGADTEPTEMLTYGKIRSAAFPAFTVGSPVYLDDTAGDLVVAQPSTTNFAIRVVGFALTAEDLLFNPSNDYTVHL